MGGTGSGNWYRWNKKTTTEEVKCIDVRYMRKQGLLKHSAQGTLSWKRRGEPSGDIGYYYYHNQLKLKYRYRRAGQEWQPVEQAITVTRTECHYGGDRPWFLCPCCNTRIAVLYGVGALFLCRHCCKLPYASQNQGSLDKLLDQKYKLGRRIFEYYECGDGWGKKKGMHWSTFNRLHRKYKALEQAWCKGITKRFPDSPDYDM